MFSRSETHSYIENLLSYRLKQYSFIISQLHISDIQPQLDSLCGISQSEVPESADLYSFRKGQNHQSITVSWSCRMWSLFAYFLLTLFNSLGHTQLLVGTLKSISGAFLHLQMWQQHVEFLLCLLFLKCPYAARCRKLSLFKTVLCDQDRHTR